MIDRARKALVQKSLSEVLGSIQELAHHYRYFGQEILQASLDQDMFRIKKLHDTSFSSIKPRGRFFVALTVCAGPEKTRNFLKSLTTALEEHSSIIAEVLEQIALAKEQRIHPRIAQPLKVRLDEAYNGFADQANELIMFLRKRHASSDMPPGVLL